MGQPQPEPTRVLLVEDDASDAEFVERQLAHGGWETRTVGTLAAALDALEHEPAGVALLDLALPDNEGPHGVQALVTAQPGLAVIVLSGNERESSAVEALQLGAQDYLLKGSWSGQLLQRAIRYAIERQRLLLANERLMMRDPQTSLPNRGFFDAALARAVALAQRNGTELGLALIDVDRVTGINDRLGHEAGDEVLEVVARRLEERVRSSDLLARISGDEFAVLLDGVRDPAALRRVSYQLKECATGRIERDGQVVHYTASVGVALLSWADGVDGLRSSANQAMRKAKSQGGDCVCAYSADGEAEYRTQLALDEGLRGAIERDELRLVFQPLYELAPQRLRGFEALLRWTWQGEEISPAVFIPIAESNGMIDQIGSYVLREAARFSASLLPARYELCVNLSSREFLHKNLAEELRTATRITGADPSCFTFEVTESVFADPASGAARQLNELRRLGCRVAIDDFGTGYSALAQLQRLPLDVLKLDRSFVAESVQSREGARLARGIIALGQGLQLTVIAEGIETEEEQRFVVASGCSVGQGYLLARPLAESVAVDLVQSSEVEQARLRAGR
jgi:diguanylate cyclase (GGDEF)-like protein